MSKDKTLPKPQDFGFDSFAQILSARPQIPGETPGSQVSFHAAMMRSLAPFTPYEMVIAENLISIEWELLQHRRMRDQFLRRLLMQSIHKAVVTWCRAEHEVALDVAWGEWCAAGHKGDDFRGDPFDKDAAAAKADDLARRSLDPNLEVSSAAHAEVEALGVDLLELMSAAYRDADRSSGSHDSKIQELERRRRSVKADLDALQKVRPLEARRDDAIEVEVLEP